MLAFIVFSFKKNPQNALLYLFYLFFCLFLFQRLIEKGAVTCVKWIPGSESKFLVSYNNPNIYIYDKNFNSLITEPQLTTVKRGNGYTIEVCKNKQDTNPICRWIVGKEGVNELAFSPDCKHLAVASQDGYLRVFDFEKQELIGSMRSYFGGLLCVCWSPDGKYIVTGGEDDLITVWSCLEERVIARGEGHRSWVNVVAFDAHMTQVGDDRADSDDEDYHSSSSHGHHNKTNTPRATERGIVSYRFGSVGDDTQLLLWEIGEDVLKPQRVRTRSTRTSTLNSNAVAPIQPVWTHNSGNSVRLHNKHDISNHRGGATSGKYNTLNKLTSKHQNSVSHFTPVVEKDDLILGSKICPRMSDMETLEPLVAKKISCDRLSALVFREDCIVTGTFEGHIYVWARPDDRVSF